MKKDRYLSIRLSEQERRSLRRSAKRAGLTVSAYVRAIADADADGGIVRVVRLDVDEGSLGALLHEMKKQGTNLNQIAFRLNAKGSVDAAELHDVLQRQKEALAALSALVDETRPHRALRTDPGADREGARR